MLTLPQDIRSLIEDSVISSDVHLKERFSINTALEKVADFRSSHNL